MIKRQVEVEGDLFFIPTGHDTRNDTPATMKDVLAWLDAQEDADAPSTPETLGLRAKRAHAVLDDEGIDPGNILQRVCAIADEVKTLRAQNSHFRLENERLQRVNEPNKVGKPKFSIKKSMGALRALTVLGAPDDMDPVVWAHEKKQGDARRLVELGKMHDELDAANVAGEGPLARVQALLKRADEYRVGVNSRDDRLAEKNRAEDLLHELLNEHNAPFPTSSLYDRVTALIQSRDTISRENDALEQKYASAKSELDAIDKERDELKDRLLTGSRELHAALDDFVVSRMGGRDLTVAERIGVLGQMKNNLHDNMRKTIKDHATQVQGLKKEIEQLKARLEQKRKDEDALGAFANLHELMDELGVVGADENGNQYAVSDRILLLHKEKDGLLNQLDLEPAGPWFTSMHEMMDLAGVPQSKVGLKDRLQKLLHMSANQKIAISELKKSVGNLKKTNMALRQEKQTEEEEGLEEAELAKLETLLLPRLLNEDETNEKALERILLEKDKMSESIAGLEKKRDENLELITSMARQIEELKEEAIKRHRTAVKDDFGKQRAEEMVTRLTGVLEEFSKENALMVNVLRFARDVVEETDSDNVSSLKAELDALHARASDEPHSPWSEDNKWTCPVCGGHTWGSGYLFPDVRAYHCGNEVCTFMTINPPPSERPVRIIKVVDQEPPEYIHYKTQKFPPCCACGGRHGVGADGLPDDDCGKPPEPGRMFKVPLDVPREEEEEQAKEEYRDIPKPWKYLWGRVRKFVLACGGDPYDLNEEGAKAKHYLTRELGRVVRFELESQGRKVLDLISCDNKRLHIAGHTFVGIAGNDMQADMLTIKDAILETITRRK